MQLYELEKRLTMDVKALAKEHEIDMTKIYVNVQTSKGAFGHYSKNQWLMGTEKKEKVNELALNPEYFNDPLEVVDTMLHELVHIYCDQHQIKDTSRGGYYHNTKFKEIATQFGLMCIPTEAGWNTTAKGNEDKLEEVNSKLPYPITAEMVRRSTERKKAPREPKEKYTYTCGSCGTSIKSTKLLYFACMECYNYMMPDNAPDEWYEHAKETLNNIKGGMFMDEKA